eukprot:6417416-Amphidinium_carterae.1
MLGLYFLSLLSDHLVRGIPPRNYTCCTTTATANMQLGSSSGTAVTGNSFMSAFSHTKQL